MEREYYDVKMTKDEMLQVLRLWFGKENAEYPELEKCACITGGLPYELIECYRNANKS